MASVRVLHRLKFNISCTVSNNANRKNLWEDGLKRCLTKKLNTGKLTINKEKTDNGIMTCPARNSPLFPKVFRATIIATNLSFLKLF